MFDADEKVGTLLSLERYIEVKGSLWEAGQSMHRSVIVSVCYNQLIVLDVQCLPSDS